MKQGSSEQLSGSEGNTTITPPSPMASVSSSQEVSGSSGCSTMSSQASDYHQVDGVTVSKEPEQELSTPAIDTLSDIIATMEEDTSLAAVEDTSLTAVEQALHEAYVSDILYDSPAPITSSSTLTTLPPSNETGQVQRQEISNCQPYTPLGISSSEAFLGDSLSEPPLEDWLFPQHATSSIDAHYFKASEASGYVTEDAAPEECSNGAQQQYQLENNLLND